MHQPLSSPPSKPAVLTRHSLLLLAGLGLWTGTQNIARAEPPTIISEESSSTGQEAFADPKLEDLTFFTREWQCTGQDKTQAAIPPFKWEMIRELDNLWFFARSTRPSTGMFEFETLGYNTIMEKFGRTIIGNDGKFTNLLSSGWDDGKMVWMGSASNMLQKTTGKHQIIVTKTGDRSFTEVEQKANEAGEWTTITSKECVIAEDPAPLNQPQ